jgi:DHA2 family methylenomycin A resistance protein-like MFS transporter
VITSAADWRWIFFLNVPAGIAALALLAGTPRSERRASHFDGLGLLTSVLALGGLTYGFIEGGAHGFTTAPVVGSFAVAVAAAVGFAAAETRQAEPMVPLHLFRYRAVSLTAATGFAVNAAFYGAIFALSLYFQQVGHRSPLATGLLFMPVTAVVTVVNLTVAARMVTRIGPRVAMAVGLAGTAAAMLVLLAVRPDLPLPVLTALMLPIAFAGSFAVPALTIMLMGSVPAERAGTAAGINNTARQVGGALAVAVIGALVGRPSGFAAGLHAGLVGIAAVLLVTTVAVLALLPRQGRRG